MTKQISERRRPGTTKQRRVIGMNLLLFSLGKQIPHTHTHTHTHTGTANPHGLCELEMRWHTLHS